MAVHTFEDAFALLRGLTNYERQGTMRYDKSALDLGRMRRLLRAVGSPERDLAVYHVAGTKGKGTVAEIVARTLGAAGLGAGLYTSPHLRDLRERIRFRGRAIPRSRFAALVEEMRPLLLRAEGRPTFFEILTALALRHFHDSGADAAVLEVGLGGRFDATNVVRPRVGAITSISRDHTRYLGRTLRAIAREKAGIAKRGVPLVSGVADGSSPGREIRRRAREAGAPLRVIGRDVLVERIRPRRGPGWRFDLVRPAGTWRDLELPILGRHQVGNAAVALEAVLVAGEADPRLAIPEEAVRRGLRAVRAEGRLQVVGRSPWMIVDTAHNDASVRATLEAVREELAPRRLAVVFGVMRDKDVTGILRELTDGTHRIYPVRVELARAMPAEEIAVRARRAGLAVRLAGTPEEAVREAREEVGEDGAVLVTGSVPLAGRVLEGDSV